MLGGCGGLLTGCGGDDKDDVDDAGGTFPVSGTVSGDVPAGAQAAVVWYLEDGNGYKAGEATISGSTFTFNAGSEPPSRGLLDMGDGTKLGVAWVMVFPEPVADGPITRAMFDTFIGYTGRSAVVWREGKGGEAWTQLFAEGKLACGSCVDGEGNRDSYAPGSCTELVLQMKGGPSGMEGCNVF